VIVEGGRVVSLETFREVSTLELVVSTDEIGKTDVGGNGVLVNLFGSISQ
jgi:hypothetical protein